jgi:hypothetical protein
MSRKRRRTPQRQPKPRTRQPANAPWWKRPLVWIGTVAGALVIAIVTAFGSGIGQTLFSAASSGEPRATASGSAVSSGTESGTEPTGPPVVVESAAYQVDPGFGFMYAFPRSETIQQVTPPGLAASIFGPDLDQISRSGGVLVGPTNLQIVLRGNAVDPVEIVGMQAVKACAPPLSGTLVYISPHDFSEGLNPIANVGFNLNALFAVAQNIDSNGNLSGNFFTKDDVSLRYGETQTFNFWITTGRYCRFTVQLTIDTSGAQIPETISNDGKPFTLTGQASLAAYKVLYEDGQRVSLRTLRADLGQHDP